MELFVKVVNSMYLRLASVLVVLIFSSSLYPSSWRPTLHLFAFAFWFGMSLWVSFVAGIVMFRTLPKRTFGRCSACELIVRFHSSRAIARNRPVETVPSLL
jgi:hypothetical protein